MSIPNPNAKRAAINGQASNQQSVFQNKILSKVIVMIQTNSD